MEKNATMMLKMNKIKAYYQHYRTELSAFRDRLKQNDLWYKGEQTEYGKNKGAGMEKAPQSRTGHLFNAIQYRHADIMDNFPHINILPREEGDEEEAKTLSGIMPFILEHAEFKKTYSKNSYEKLKSGTAAYGVFYKTSEEDGVGDICIEAVDLLRLSFQPGIEDLQESKYIFYDSFMDIEEFKALYGDADGVKTQATYDENEGKRDFLDDVVVITDCYYKVLEGGKKILHFVKFSGEKVLEYTEGKEEYAEGFYKHGRYPFVFDVLHPEPGEAYGRGLIDNGKNVQAYIDKLDEIINKHALLNSSPRNFVKISAGVNEKELLDITQPFVHVAGDLESSIKEIKTGSLPSFIVNHRENKIMELKEILGNRDFSQGGTTGGVTAASAITALQNSGDKLSRDMISESYYAFSQIVWLIIELVREFFDEERTYRVLGEDASYSYVSYSNKGLKERPVLGELEGLIPADTVTEMAEVMEMPLSYEKPVFDITLTVEKNNPYQRSQHNSLIISLYQLGLFTPQNLTLGRFVISNLNFDGKDKILQQIDEMNEQMQAEQAAMQQQAMEQASMEQMYSEGAGNEDEMLAFPIEQGGGIAEESEMLAIPMM